MSNFVSGNDTGIKTKYSKLPTQVYTEDEYFEEFTASRYQPKCGNQFEIPEPKLAFDYGKFDEYLRAKLQVEQINRSVQVMRGQTPPGLEYYTNKVLQLELLNIYGKDLDTSSATFQGVFQTYREQRLEQIEEWLELEKDISKDGTSEDFMDEEDYLLMQFTNAEIKSFKDVANGATNPFKLPKKPSTTVPDQTRKKGGVLAQRNEQIASEVKLVLQRYSTGITKDKLIDVCNEKLSRRQSQGTWLNLNSELIEGYLTKQKILVVKQFDTGKPLIFPASEEYLSAAFSPLQILWSFRHKILIVLNLSLGIVEVSQCLEQCKNIFQNSTTFSHIDWGFESDIAFLRYLFEEKWRSTGVDLIQNPSKTGKNAQHYLAVITEKRKQFLEQKIPREDNRTKVAACNNQPKRKTTNDKVKKMQCAGPQNSVAPEPSTSSAWGKPQPKEEPLPVEHFSTFIGASFVQPGDSIGREQDRLKPGDRLECVVALAKSPTNIYLVRRENWQNLNKLFDQFREYWFSTESHGPPHPKFLNRGYLCMSKTKEDDVYRVVILANKNSKIYQVFCIDFGDVLLVEHTQIRYMPKEFLYLLDAQAIHCALYNVVSSKKDNLGSDIWSGDVCEYTLEMLASNDFPTTMCLFKQRVNGTGKWLVKLSTATINDCGESVMKFVNKTR